MEILLLDELAPDAQLWLSDRHQVSYQPMLAHDRAELHRRLYKTRALFVTPEVRVDSALLDFAPCLAVVACLHGDTENIDDEACRRRRVRVLRAINANVRANAEFQLGNLMMMMRNGAPQPVMPLDGVPLRGREINDSVIGLLGMTPTAHLLATLLTALGARVIGFDPALHRTADLWQRLGVQPGDTVWVEVMEGRQPRLTLPVAQLLDESMGMNAYMSLPALNRALGDDDLASSAFLLVDKGMETSVLRELDRRPLVSSAESQAASLRNYRSTISTFTRIFTFMATLMGAIINFGVVYNSARMSLSERTRELASLRVLGFTRGEVSYILLGELALLVLLSLPVAAAVGYALSAFVAHGMSTELFRVPLIVRPSTFAFPSFVTCVSAIISALAVNWRVRRLDLIEALKTRE